MNESSTQPRLGLIGVGLLGSAIAGRAVRSGYAVAGYDLNPAQLRQLQRFGGQPLTSAREVARTSRRLILALPHSGVTRDVLAEIQTALVAGTVILDATTGHPEEMAALARQLARRGVRYLDSTILGSSADVAAGRAVAMVGGRPADFRRVRPFLRCFTNRQFHCGECGAGARMKLVVNLVLGLNRAALAEGLAFARATGVDPKRALAVLRAGLAYSRVMDAKGPKMLRGDFKPVARLSQHLKDVRLILEAAQEHDLVIPLSVEHEQLLSKVAADGGGDLDNSAVILAYNPPLTPPHRKPKGTL